MLKANITLGHTDSSKAASLLWLQSHLITANYINDSFFEGLAESDIWLSI